MSPSSGSPGLGLCRRVRWLALATFWRVLWTGVAGLAVVRAGVVADREASLPNLLCCCFGDGALGPRKLTLAAVVCNSDDTENYTGHANLIWNPSFLLVIL